jgi:hypothetical protein
VGALVVAALGVGAVLLARSLRGGAAANLVEIRTDALTYGVPADWTPRDTPLNDSLGVVSTGIALAPGYDCGGGSYLRGLVGGSELPGGLTPDSVAPQAAEQLATEFYTLPDGSEPAVTLAPSRTVDVGGVESVLSEATARTAGDDGCLATSGTVLVLAVPTTAKGGGDAVELLVVNGDTAGGPDATPVLDRATLDAIVASVRPTAG